MLLIWVPDWFLRFVGRTTCRLLRWHNVTCRGRMDHMDLVNGCLIDPDRWGRWPR